MSQVFFHTGGGQIISRGQLKVFLIQGNGERRRPAAPIFCGTSGQKCRSWKKKKTDKVTKLIIQNTRELRFCLNTVIIFLCVLQKSPALM